MLEFWWLQKHQYNTKVTACTKLKCQDLDNAEAGHYMEEDSRSCTDMYVAEIFLFHSFYVFLQTAILLIPVSVLLRKRACRFLKTTSNGHMVCDNELMIGLP